MDALILEDYPYRWQQGKLKYANAQWACQDAGHHMGLTQLQDWSLYKIT